MRKKIGRAIGVWLGVLCCFGRAAAQERAGSAFPPCTGRFQHRRLDPKILAAVLTDHAVWVKDGGAQKMRADILDERRANLCGANLSYAKLQGAYLSSATLQGAYLSGTTLQGTFFEPLSLPSISTIARAQGLSEITFSLPFAAVELRENFEKMGLREQARQLTYAINN